ncbi:MAG: T9SS type A sorting domain-containing protein, partial [Bacteroidota bacterium]
IIRASVGDINGSNRIIFIEDLSIDQIEADLYVRICEGQSYTFDNTVYSVSGEFTATFTSYFGCDSIVHLELEVLEALEESVNVDLCEGDTYNGLVYTVDAILVDNLVTAEGCDSLFRTFITVHYPSIDSSQISLCRDDTYQGQVYEQDTVLVENWTSIFGCDSSIYTQINIEEHRSTFLSDTIDLGTVYPVGSSVYDETGLYRDTLSAANGCDSIVVLDLTVVDLVAIEAISIAEQYDLMAFPNPFQQQTTLQFVLPQTEEVSISVLDVHGRYLFDLAAQKLFSAGRHQISVAGPLAAGLYLFRVRIGEAETVLKLVRL